MLYLYTDNMAFAMRLEFSCFDLIDYSGNNAGYVLQLHLLNLSVVIALDQWSGHFAYEM